MYIKRGEHNLIYSLSKCFEGPVLRMDLNCMPYGLLDYTCNIHFFACNYVQFAHKWLCLHGGPVWHYELEPQATECVNVDEADNSDTDIIQSALQQSSLSLEGRNDTVDFSDTTPGAFPFLQIKVILQTLL